MTANLLPWQPGAFEAPLQIGAQKSSKVDISVFVPPMVLYPTPSLLTIMNHPYIAPGSPYLYLFVSIADMETESFRAISIYI